MANTKPKRPQSVRITINPELEEMLEGLKTRFRGLDYPVLFKLALSSYYRQKLTISHKSVKKPQRNKLSALRDRHTA
jgi:hypothetical protein